MVNAFLNFLLQFVFELCIALKLHQSYFLSKFFPEINLNNVILLSYSRSPIKRVSIKKIKIKLRIFLKCTAWMGMVIYQWAWHTSSMTYFESYSVGRCGEWSCHWKTGIGGRNWQCDIELWSFQTQLHRKSRVAERGQK